MSRSAVADLLRGAIPVETPVTLAGWLRSRRSSKGGFSFLAVHDGSAFDAIQVVADQALPNYEAIAALGPGCAVEIEGTLVASQGKGQSVEVVASAVTILGEVDDPATDPVAKKGHTFEYLRTVAHLRPRTNTFGALARVLAFPDLAPEALEPLTAFAAGTFLYVALCDLLPEVFHERRDIAAKVALLLVGLGISHLLHGL